MGMHLIVPISHIGTTELDCYRKMSKVQFGRIAASAGDEFTDIEDSRRIITETGSGGTTGTAVMYPERPRLKLLRTAIGELANASAILSVVKTEKSPNRHKNNQPL